MDMYRAHRRGPDHWHREIEAWQQAGGTHVTVRTTDASSSIHGYPRNAFTTPGEHIAALERFKTEVFS